MIAIWKKDFHAIFLSFRGWGLLFFFSVLEGFYFFNLIDQYSALQKTSQNLPSLESLLISFWNCVLVAFTLGIPFLTAPSYGEEQKEKTLHLLYCAPLSSYDIFFGKYLAVLSFFLLAMFASLVYPLYLVIYGEPALQLGALAVGFLGLFLMGHLYLVIGLFVSEKIKSTLVSFLLTFFCFLILGFFHNFKEKLSYGFLRFLMEYMTPSFHGTPFFEGIIQVSHVCYFLLFPLCLVLMLEKKWMDRMFLSLIFLGSMFLTQRPTFDLRFYFGYLSSDISDRTKYMLKKAHEKHIHVQIKGYFRDISQRSLFEKLLRQYEEYGFHPDISFYDPDIYLLQAKTDQITQVNEVLIQREGKSPVHLNQWDEEHLSPLLYRLIEDDQTILSVYPKNQEMEDLLLRQGFVVKDLDPSQTHILLIPPQEQNLSIEEKKLIEDVLKHKGKAVFMAQAFQPVNNLNDLLKPFGVGFEQDFLVLRDDHPLAQKIGQNHSLFVFTEDSQSKGILTDCRSLNITQMPQINVHVLAQTQETISVDNVTSLEDISHVEPSQIHQNAQKPVWALVDVQDQGHPYAGFQGMLISGREPEPKLLLQSLWRLQGKSEGGMIPSQEQRVSRLLPPDQASLNGLYGLTFFYPFVFLFFFFLVKFRIFRGMPF